MSKSIARSGKKRKLFEQWVGQPVKLITPPGFYEFQEKLRQPQPQVALTIETLRSGQIRRLRLAGESEARYPSEAMTLAHPFMVKLLADYRLHEQYESQGLTIYRYTRCPQPVLVQTGPGSFVVAEEEVSSAPVSSVKVDKNHLTLPHVTRGTDTLEAWDLQIASKKYGRGSVSQADSPIVWWQVRGKDKEAPSKPVSLLSGPVMKKLMSYELVKTITREFEIIRQYRRLNNEEVIQ